MTTLDGNPNSIDLNFPGLGPDTIFAGAGADTVITARLGGSLIFGERDNDILVAVGPNDTLYGGEDEDSLTAEDTPALLFGDAGPDTVIAEAPATLYGGAGEDFVQGTAEANLMFGNEDADTMLGGAQRQDSLYGGKGNDSLGFFVEGGGNNIFTSTSLVTGAGGNEGTNFLRGDLGDDLVVGINQRDTLYGGKNNDLLRTVGSNSYASGDDDNDTLEVRNSTTLNPFLGTNVVVGLERITLIGGAGNDSLYGGIGFFNRGRNVYEGGEGSDTISAFASQDTVLGGEGNDLIRSLTSDVLSSDGPLSSFPGFAGKVSLDGGAGDDTVVAQFSTDTMIGGGGNDSLSGLFAQALGEEGNDTIRSSSDGGTSTALSTLNGGLGNDYLIGNTTPEAINFFDGGDGDDSIELAGTGDVLVGSFAGNDTIFYNRDANFDATVALSPIIDTIGSNFIIGNAGSNVFTTGDGNDVLFGSFSGASTDPDGDDTLNGGGGNDTLLGGNQNDYLYGGNGNDSLGGGAGTDTLIGGAGSDSFYYANAGEGADAGADAINTSPDQIGDFRPNEGDKLVFRRAGFSNLAADPNNPNAISFEGFAPVNTIYVNSPGLGRPTTPVIFYQIQDGRLGFDPDGSGPTAGVTLAILNNAPRISGSDILLI
jgi:Ca2+-binding RTX toxin-like protein